MTNDYRIISAAELIKIDPDYKEAITLGKILNHDIVKDDNGTIRWKANSLMTLTVSGVCPMYEGAWHGKNKKFLGALDLNKLWVEFHAGRFTITEFMKYYMQTGYSISGFLSVFREYIDEVIETYTRSEKPVKTLKI